ncbi:alpha/beta fold hydrolase [Marinomonas lutimaris]|uniref:alpha/beta fold hydrolase n=1 Tax=Marinomonas lutimaris TaxID=2846746 RepID=UPI001C666437|nr:alpha/beta hydrolase [Marinomonas lutimaris]
MIKIARKLALSSLLYSFFLMFFTPLAFASDQNYKVVSADGVSLAVQESGAPEGIPIIFVHGLLGSHLSWSSQINDPQLAKNRLITFDLRGHGLSDQPEAIESYQNGRLWGDDLAAVIESIKTTSPQKPILVGWSLGGSVISSYLATYGDSHIAGVMYVGGVIELAAGQITPHPKTYSGMADEDLKTHLEAERHFIRLCFNTQPDTETFELLLANAATASFNMQKTVPSMNVDVVNGLGKLTKPFLLIYGAHDALVNPNASLKRVKELNSTSQSKIYENSGHSPFFEESTRFNNDIINFINNTMNKN